MNRLIKPNWIARSTMILSAILFTTNCFASTFTFNDGGLYGNFGVTYKNDSPYYNANQSIRFDTNELSAVIREVEYANNSLTFKLSTTATLYQTNWNPNTFTWNQGNLLSNNIQLDFGLTVNGVTPTTKPEGLFALVATGATTVSSNLSLSGYNFDGRGGNDVLTVDGLIANPMNFFNANPGSWKYELKDVGTFAAAVAQIDGLGDGFSGLAWLTSAYRNNVFVNGVLSDQYAIFRGDVHFTNDIPEPASMALLGLGVLGGALRRKKNQAV